MSDGESSFAEFEAAANAPEAAPEAPPAAKAPADGTTEPKPADTPPEALELTDGDEAVDVPEGEEGGEPHADDKRRRSKPASQRIAELTAKLRDAERKLATKDTPEQVTVADKPDPASFEFGEADPAYIDALTDWKIDSREATRAKAAEANASRQQFVDRINTGVSGAETSGKAKYADFEAKVTAAVEARAGEPLPPLLTVGIGLSPVGGDIIYRLATDEAASARLEKLAKGGEATSNAMAMALGEIEGEYLADDSDGDLDMTDQLDLSRMLGRMRTRMKGAKPKPVVTTTNAPEPPQHQARGGSGRFAVGADTSDFAAFEKMVNAKR